MEKGQTILNDKKNNKLINQIIIVFKRFISIEMDAWDGDECNQYVGTDSTIFPPFMSKEEGNLFQEFS